MAGRASWLLLLLGVLPAAPGPAPAHELRIEREGGSLALHYGHSTPGAQHAGPTGTESGFVREALCFDADGASTPVPIEPGPLPRFPGDCAATWALVSTGYWTKTPAGAKNIPATEAEHPISSWQSFESVKRLDGWSEALAQPLTAGLEIVPLIDPRTVPPGKKLDVRVVRGGEPVPGLPVACDDKVRGQTGADGTIRLMVPDADLVIIQVTAREPHPGPEADEIVTTAGLVFEPEAKE